MRCRLAKNFKRGPDLIPAYRHRFQPNTESHGYGSMIVERYRGKEEAAALGLKAPDYVYSFVVSHIQAAEAETVMRDLSKALVANEGL